MNVTVYRALEIPPDDHVFPEAEFALVPGAPFLVDDDSLTVLEGPLFYLAEKFPEITVRRRNRGGSTHTIKAAAADLADFVQAAEESVGDWQQIDNDFVIEYCEELFATVNPRTQEPLKAETVFRHAFRALDYCHWRQENDLPVAVTEFDVAWYKPRILRPGRRHPIDTKAETEHIRGQKPWLSTSRRGGHGNPARNRGVQNHKRATSRHSLPRHLEQPQWDHIKQDLGPLPSERSADDDRPSRDRLAAELSHASGMRVDEIANLTIYQLLDLRLDPALLPQDTLELHISHTKGLKPRDVTIPTYLLREIQTYIRTERRSCIEEAKKYWLPEGKKPSPILFLNGVSARRDAGKPVTPDTLSTRFHEAVMRCGFYRRVPVVDRDGREVDIVKVALLTFHSLRHTYAAIFYRAEKHNGNSSPWKQLCSRLGHADEATTINTYLHFDETKRREVNTTTFSRTREKYSGH